MKKKTINKITGELKTSLEYWRNKLILAENSRDAQAIKLSKGMIDKYLDEFLKIP